MKHALTCPAYGNYQPPYEECTCGADGIVTMFEKLTDAKDACEEYARERKTLGSENLYHSVWHLWNRTEAGPL